jgi:hypothetical protein
MVQEYSVKSVKILQIKLWKIEQTELHEFKPVLYDLYLQWEAHGMHFMSLLI